MALALLLISLAAFALGPLLYGLADRARATLAALDGFVMVAVSGLVLIHIMPHAAMSAGPAALLVALFGFVAPGFVEHRLERAARQTHTAALVIALAGLTAHEFFDGVGLASTFYGEAGGISLLAVAVVLHRLPISVTIWWLLRPTRGAAIAAAVLAGLGLATVSGYALASSVGGAIDARWVGLLEALIAGSLLHVVVHRPSPLSTPSHDRFERLLAGTGALAGLAAVAALGSEHYIPHGPSSIGFADVFTTLVLESAPALVIAFALAGLVQVVLPGASLRWMRTGRPLSEAVRGVAFGLPLPICSCGVIPLYQALVVQGVPATAAMAFLVATPELGIDAVLISVPLLGAAFTALRIACATLVAIAIGAVIGRLAGETGPAAVPLGSVDAGAVERPAGLLSRARAGLRFGFGEVVDHTAPWILLGIAIASLAEPALRGEWIAALPWGADVVLCALLGMPMYVCASGATPFVAVLVAKGISPGAALAFLLTGPATNATTFGVLGRLHGTRVALWFGGAIAILTVGLGLAVNLAFPGLEGLALYEATRAEPSLIQAASLAILTVTLAVSVLRQGPRGFVGQILSPYGRADDHDHHHHDPENGSGQHAHDACCP